MENGGRLLARTLRVVQTGHVAEDQVDVVADVDGGYLALVLMTAIRIRHWQQIGWVEARFSPETF